MKTFKVTVDGQDYTVQVEELTDKSPLEKASQSGSSKPVTAEAETKQTKAAAPVPVTEKPQKAPQPAAGGGMSIKAPMPGSVIEVKVKEGDAVKDGDVLLILEAMKMENELTASQAGTVAQILVKKGDTVNSGDPLIILS